MMGKKYYWFELRQEVGIFVKEGDLVEEVFGVIGKCWFSDLEVFLDLDCNFDRSNTGIAFDERFEF